jgi:hypothetical protein
LKGGWRKFIDTHYLNPQFKLIVGRDTPLWIFMQQYDRRDTGQRQTIPIGFVAYRYEGRKFIGNTLPDVAFRSEILTKKRDSFNEFELIFAYEK